MRMLKVFLVLMLGIGVIFITVPGLYADETSEAILKILINKGIISQEEVEEMKAEIKKAKPKVPEALEERVAVLEEKIEDRSFLSIQGADFQLPGELEYEFVDTGRDGSDNRPHFQLDKLVLQPKLKIGDNLSLDAQVYVLESGADTKLNEIHAKFSDFLGDTWVDVGLYERWVKSQYNRQLEGYPLVGTAFWRDDALTASWGGEFKPFYWMLSVGNGYELNRKQVSEDTADNNDILHDNHATSGLSDSMEYGINLGFKQDLFEGKLDILGFYYDDELSGADKAYLQAQFPNYTSSSDDKNILGLSARYDRGDWRLAGQYITAETGGLDRDAWVVETGYHFKFAGGRKWLTGVMPIVSYGQLDIDDSYDRNWSNPLSWDRQKTMLGLIFDLYKNTKLKTEYYINNEDSGGDDISNNEFLTQLEIKF